MEKTKGVAPVPFWQDIVLVLSVFLIAFSVPTLIGVNRLNAENKKQLKEEVKIVSLASLQKEKKVTVQSLPVPVESIEPTATAIIKEAIVKEGEGIEHALIRQLQLAEPERGKKWAQKRAHQIAMLSGFVDTGGEVRVKDGSSQVQVAYVLSGDQIITYSQGQEVRRTQIADSYQQAQTISLQSFEFQYGSG